jgi:hypothetical protein
MHQPYQHLATAQMKLVQFFRLQTHPAGAGCEIVGQAFVLPCFPAT